MQDLEFFNYAEIEQIVSSTKNEKHRLQILLMSDAGLRVSEVTDLKWSDLDFKKKLIFVDSLKKGDSKESKRTIPISDKLYNQFAKVIEKTKTNDLKGYIFSNDNEPIARQSVNKMLKDIEGKNPNLGNIHPHKLRHSFASNLRLNGAEIIDIRDLLGHEKVETSLIYAHPTADILRSKINGKKTFWQKLIARLRPAIRPTNINLTVKDKSFVVGRDTEIEQIQSHLAKNLHLVLMGAPGSGKSHILDSLNFGSRKIIEFDTVKDFKKSLLNIILWLFNDDKEQAAAMIMMTRDKTKYEKKLQTESVNNLIIMIKGIIEPNEYILKIGDLDDLTPAVAKHLESLKKHFTIVTTARRVKPECFGFLSNFQRIDIKPLDRTNSLQLFHRLTDDLIFDNHEYTKNEVWRVSDGSPKTIVELAERFRKEPVLTGDIVEEITANYLGRNSNAIDMSIYFFFIFAGLVVLKFVGRAEGDADLRTVGGLIAIVLMFGRFFFNSRRKS